MGPAFFSNQSGQSQNSERRFTPLDPEEFSKLCWAVKDSAAELEAIAFKAAIHSGDSRRSESQESYVTMMLGSLAALDKLRQRLTRS